jgi:hypothetical protein
LYHNTDIHLAKYGTSGFRRKFLCLQKMLCSSYFQIDPNRRMAEL